MSQTTPNKETNKKIKSVKAWGIYKFGSKDYANRLFQYKEYAQDYLDEKLDDTTKRIEEKKYIKSQYKIIQVLITPITKPK